MFHSFKCLIPTNTYKWERCCRKVYAYCGILQSFLPFMTLYNEFLVEGAPSAGKPKCDHELPNVG